MVRRVDGWVGAIVRGCLSGMGEHRNGELSTLLDADSDMRGSFIPEVILPCFSELTSLFLFSQRMTRTICACTYNLREIPGPPSMSVLPRRFSASRECQRFTIGSHALACRTHGDCLHSGGYQQGNLTTSTGTPSSPELKTLRMVDDGRLPSRLCRMN